MDIKLPNLPGKKANKSNAAADVDAAAAAGGGSDDEWNNAGGGDVEAPPPPTQVKPPKHKLGGGARKKRPKNAGANEKSSATTTASLFPTPQQVVMIYTPIVHVIHQIVDPETGSPLRLSDQHERHEENRPPTATTPSASGTSGTSVGDFSEHERVTGSYVQGPWRDYVDAPSLHVPTTVATATTTAATNTPTRGTPLKPRKRKINVRVGKMVIKMLNRLVSEHIIAHDRVMLSRTQTHLLVRILANERTVPILLMRCERIGIGVVVGAAFGTGLEWCQVPTATLEGQNDARPFRLDDLAVGGVGQGMDMAGGGGGGGGGPGALISMGGVKSKKEKAAPSHSAAAAAAAASRASSQGLSVTLDKEVPFAEEGEDAVNGANGHGNNDADDDEEEEEVSISSEDDIDDDDADIQQLEKAAKPSTVRAIEDKDDNVASSQKPDLPLQNLPLSNERKERLGQLIADARRDWLDTGSRLRVLQVLESVEAGAALTFDYIAYVLLAAWVAAMGLVSNSVAVVVASMLLSPLMGPCLGATLGATLRKNKLVKLGLKNECISLLLCVLVGFVIAGIMVPAQTPSVQAWPASEMTGRGTVNGLVLGIFIAIPSGAGVALSLLGRNSGGLTGVAISLSLLPPAVNAGICWMAAILYSTGAVPRTEGDETDYAFTGAMSLCLTLVNICCIFIGGCTTFALKEISPATNKNTFWSRDVKIARQHSTQSKMRNELEPNIRTIKMGVKAALELREAMAQEGNLYAKDQGTHQKDPFEDEFRLAQARRRGLAANVLEDALFVGGGNFVGGGDREIAETIIPGGAIPSDLLPDEDTYFDDGTVDTAKESLLDVTGVVGGLEDAGEMLFSEFAKDATELPRVKKNPWDDKFADYGIDHEDVAQAVLLS